MQNVDDIMSDVEARDRERAEREKAEHGSADAAKLAADVGAIGDVAVESGSVPFTAFASIDLRVGKVIGVEEHSSAKKPMYILKVDLGELGTRTIVAGIRSYYSKEELIGKNIVVVANLQQRKIAGILSEGMLLAAENGADVVLLAPDREIAPGSKIG